ncbi:class II histone deacetylase [Virgibacillus sp. NKC19-3]|uniref:class II histone deacetylase n=1 Tax=Virgibacillus saliphilus TaxID=2831674 RepID=UPI001C9A51E6|nr:class II histone deacetylase [Virgibacillus sp. NKC19-3]MBY7144423.1 class II histone deacetylase [Virgibacillus sp. NKC19-3]
MTSKTGFVCDESYFWHQTGNGALNIRSGGWVQADIHAENPESKRRVKNLLERSNFMDELQQIKPRHATHEEVALNHSKDYINRVQELSDAGGGDAGEHAIVGPESYEIALNSTGGVLASVDAVMEGKVQNAYALVRPPGHHAEPNEGMGFCLFNNVTIAAKYARKKYGLKRILILDWDVHHGNGTETAFEHDSDVLFISIHQENIFPKNRGDVAFTGKEDGEGYNINIELPAGTGDEGYLYAFDRLIEPIIKQFEPELIFISAGQDASRFDPIGRMLLTAEGYFQMSKRIKNLAEKHSNGRLIACHEGGYSTAYVPFCTLRVIEGLCGKRSQVEDPFNQGFHEGPIYPHQKEAVHRAMKVQSTYWNLKSIKRV